MKSYSSLISEVLTELNNLRSNPSEFASRMESIRPYYRDDNIFLRDGAAPVLTREGLAALDIAISFVRDLDPLHTLHCSKGLTKAAQLLCDDLGPAGVVSHLDSQGRTSRDRARLFGQFKPGLGEVLNFGSVSGFEAVCSMIVDDGISSRPHRKLLLSERFNQVGIGAAAHKEFGIVICCLIAQEYEEADGDVDEVVYCKGEFRADNKDIPQWKDSAVKVTCVVKVDRRKKNIRTKSYWELRDGNTQVTEEIGSFSKSFISS